MTFSELPIFVFKRCDFFGSSTKLNFYDGMDGHKNYFISRGHFNTGHFEGSSSQR